jgi:hypothetical protein
MYISCTKPGIKEEMTVFTMNQANVIIFNTSLNNSALMSLIYTRIPPKSNPRHPNGRGK